MNTSDGLRQWEQRIPHFEFLIELFTDETDSHHWDMARVMRFIRFRKILMRNWRAMEAQTRQMADHEGFQKLWKVINAVKDALRSVWEQVERVAYRHRMCNQFATLQRREGVLLN